MDNWLNIKRLDNKIGELIIQYNEEEDEVKRTVLLEEIEALKDIRIDLKTSRVEGSNSHLWISGAISIASILLVMNYEEEDVITTKAWNIVTRIFKN